MEDKQDSNSPLAFRVKDFCARIGISPSTFWKLVSRGEIRVIRIGGRTLVPATEVSRLLSGEAA
jgi:excisionase family DNA binding protein